MNFSEKYDKYSAMIYRVCVVRLGSKHDAEDVVQNVFIKLYYKAPNFATDEEEKAWLIRVALNACKDSLKAFWNKKTVSLEEAANLSSAEMEDVERLIDIFNLPPKYRTVLQLFYYEGYSVKEIAKIMKISEKTVTSQLCRARKRLKIEMEVGEYAGA
ncbi:MAG: RNA polymerase sigma factor [Clostridiales bacterium]|jgi:RNA polymerase sigma-70 factor (ECF subfamily)|nr:RNA polymerase sigma factor [Clostridiales bacterium]